jgi:disease resistance protein RPS2
MALYRSLSEELGLKPELNANPEDYKLKLHSQFRRKRVFLVLDDVWQDKAFDSLDLAKGKGSVTLLSTRNQSLLKRPSPHIKQEHMTGLSKEDSWSLFCVHAFRPPSNVPCELEALAQSMAEECQGLPLALKVIGGAMFRKASCEWESLLKKLRESRMYERPVEEELFERLKLGYDLLSEDDWRLKQCFHYFAAYPEDHKIYFDRVLYHWIGEGLVPAHDGDDPRADAFSLLNKLSERSFIESHGEIGPSLIYMKNDLLRFKVHDVMRDLAFYILEKDCGTPPGKQLYFYRAGQNLEEVPKECTAIPEALRLSLDTNKLEKLPESFYAPKLVSLLLGLNRIVSLSASFFSYFPKLRVLDLRHGRFYSLPEELGDLKDLVCLDLSGCSNLQILPDTIGKLHMLKCLDLNECWELNYLPSGVVGLTSLQVLHTYCCRKLWAKPTPSGMARATIGASLEDICELVVLTELTITHTNQLPHKISALTKLNFLTLRIGVQTLPHEMSHAFKQLKDLDLCSCEKLEYLPRSFTCCGAFPALVRIELRSCEKLVEFPEVDEGALPRLQILDLSFCDSLRSLPLSLELLTSLRELDLSYCEKAFDSCRTNCEKSPIWRRLHIRYG